MGSGRPAARWLRSSAAFPVGLYGMLLFALAWLTLPQVFAPIERVLVGSACVLPRVASKWLGEPVRAESEGAMSIVRELGLELQERVERHDFAGSGISMPAGYERVLCGVLAARRAGGGGGPSELLLDHSYRELEGCEPVVTKGAALVGFVMRPGQAGAVDDEPDDPARIMLCNHANAPRLYAALDGGRDLPLHFVVRPASVVDPAGMVVDIWDEPYRAARLRRVGDPVETRALGHNGVPDGLLLGRTLIWGYRSVEDEQALPIGVYITSAVDASALSHVVVWRSPEVSRRAAERRAVTGSSPLRDRRAVNGTTYSLPGAGHGRHLLVVDDEIPDGAAVVQDGLFLGTAKGLRFGVALMTSFASSRDVWSLLFLPDDDDADPVEMRARVERGDDGKVELRWQGARPGDPGVRGPGYLFTGSNGRFCPGGLWIGRAEPDRFQRDLLHVLLPDPSGPRRVSVFAAPESGGDGGRR